MRKSLGLLTVITLLLIVQLVLIPVQPVNSNPQTTVGVSLELDSPYYLRGGDGQILLQSTPDTTLNLKIYDPFNNEIHNSDRLTDENGINTLNFPVSPVSDFGDYRVVASVNASVATAWFTVPDVENWSPTDFPYVKEHKGLTHTIFANKTLVVNSEAGERISIHMPDLPSGVTTKCFSTDDAFVARFRHDGIGLAVDMTFLYIYKGAKLVINGTFDSPRDFSFEFASPRQIKHAMNSMVDGNLVFDWSDLMKHANHFTYDSVNKRLTVTNLPQTFSIDPEIFSYGFEGGDTSEFDSEQTNSATIAVDGNAYAGSYGMNVTGLDGSGDYGYVTDNVGTQDELYVQCHVKSNAVINSNTWNPALGISESQTTGRVKVVYAGGTTKWGIEFTNTGYGQTYIYESGTTAFSASTWYKIKLHFKESTGTIELWIDDVEKISNSSLAILDEDYDEVWVGCIAGEASDDTEMYYDDVIASTEDIASDGYVFSDWDNYLKLTVDHDDVDEVLTNFTVLVHLSSSSGINGYDATAVFDEIGADYNATAFYSADNSTRLYWEPDSWNDTSEVGDYWVLLPSVSNTSDTIFWLAYNSTLDGSEYNSPHDVWVDYAMVQHMNDATTSTILDSTSNDNDGTKNAINEPIEIDGQIARAQDFDGIDADITVLDSASLNLTTSVMINVWIKPTSFVPEVQGIVDKITYWSAGYVLYLTYDTLRFRVQTTTGQKTLDVSATGLENTWLHVVSTYDSVSGDIITYVNNVPTSSSYTGTIVESASDLYIGVRGGANVMDFTGIIDEVEISTARSSAWVGASYETQRDHFLVLGSNAPTSDSMTITNMDDIDNFYAQIRVYTIDYDATDYDGYENIDYVTLNLTQGATDRFAVKYDNATDAFSVLAGEDKFELVAGSSAIRSGNTLNISVTFMVEWDATEEADLELKAYIVDSDGNSDTDTMQTDYVDVVTNLVVSGFACDDDRGDLSQTITFTGTVYYANDPSSATATTFYPADADFTSVSIYDAANNNEGSDASISNGAFSVAFAADAAVGIETYNPYIALVDGNYTDAEESPTDTYISDQIVGYWEQVDDANQNVNSNSEWRIKAVLDYDDHALGAGDTIVSSWGALSWDAGNSWFDISHTESTVDAYTITLASGTEATYTITSFTENITETSVIFDRIQVQSYAVVDSQVPVDDNGELNVTILYDYDDTSVTDGTVLINGLTATHLGSGVWNITDTEAVVVINTYDNVSASGNTYGITVEDQNGESTTIMWDSDPTVNSFSVSDSTVATSELFTINMTINDVDGIADIKNATLELSENIILLWDKDTDTFSEYQDTNGYMHLGGAGASTATNATAYDLQFSLSLYSNMAEGLVDVVADSTLCADSLNQTGSGSSASLFTFSSTSPSPPGPGPGPGLILPPTDEDEEDEEEPEGWQETPFVIPEQNRILGFDEVIFGVIFIFLLVGGYAAYRRVSKKSTKQKYASLIDVTPKKRKNKK